MSVRQKLIDIQKRLVKKLKTELYQDYCRRNPQIDQYYEDYKRLTGRYERISTKQELIEAILGSDITYIGDYHTLRQSQKTLIRLLESICRENTPHKPIIIGLEMIHSKYQAELDSYLSGHMNDPDFLKTIDYDRTWDFDWNHYKVILYYAKEHRIAVIALNSEPSLTEKGEKVDSLARRDAHAAKIIAATRIQNPDSIIIALFGDLHISENHLPAQVDKLTTPPPKKLIICQNSERIYWQLAQAGEEQKIDVVKIKDGVYCVINSTPLAVFQSLIHWYNREQQIRGSDRESEPETSFMEEVSQLIKTICGFLEMSEPNLDDFTVCTAHDLELIKHLKQKNLSPEEARLMELDLLKTESYFVDKKNLLCLANFSLNHAAEQAAHFIHHQYVADKITGLKRNRQNKFYYAVLREALGFLGSKIINHKRLCYKELDFADFLSQYQGKRLTNPRLKEIYRISRFVVEHKKREKDFWASRTWRTYRKISYLSVEDFIGISHALGYMLGNRLYEGVLHGIIKRTEIQALFANPFKGPEALKKYLHLVQRVQTVKETYLRKTEHL